MKDPAGQAAPAGGFQNLGWYSGYQYNNGTFAPQAGMINPTSPQQGAGQPVSAEVNRQTSVAAGKAPDANQNFVNQQNGTALTAAPGGDSGPAGTGGGTGTGDGSGAGFSAAAPLDLPGLLDSLTKSSGVTDLQNKVADLQNGLNTAKSQINDNPFLSEGDRTGRIAKLQADYDDQANTLNNQIVTKQADIQTQLDIQTKQFDINSQAATQALNQFNTLLQDGALDNASGQDIANITKSTGLSSQAIESAISANKAKNVQTSVIQYDDGTNQGFAVVNTQTGQIISKQVVSASKPSATSSGGTPGSSQYLSSAISTVAPQIASKLNSYGNISPSDWNTALAAWLGAGLSQKDFVANFGQYADENRGDFQTAYGFANPKTASTIKQNQAVNSKP